MQYNTLGKKDFKQKGKLSIIFFENTLCQPKLEKENEKKKKKANKISSPIWTSQMIFKTNQLAGFYMDDNIFS